LGIIDTQFQQIGIDQVYRRHGDNDSRVRVVEPKLSAA
jgi:hypothetical protein